MFTFASAYLQGRVKIPIGGIVREPEGLKWSGLWQWAQHKTGGTSRWNYGTDSDPAGMASAMDHRSIRSA